MTDRRIDYHDDFADIFAFQTVHDSTMHNGAVFPVQISITRPSVCFADLCEFNGSTGILTWSNIDHGENSVKKSQWQLQIDDLDDDGP